MKIRIFVIDDERLIINLFKSLFEGDEYELIVADEPTSCMVYNGYKCDHEYACGDILFVDKDMPKMNGIEFIEHMTKKGCKGLLKNKVIMSGRFTQDDIYKAKELGCIILEKPFSIYKVKELVDEMKKRIRPDRKLEPLYPNEVHESSGTNPTPEHTSTDVLPATHILISRDL